MVYDSDDEDEDMNICDDGHSMTSEQRKVLSFYNEGSDQELATIQVNNDAWAIQGFPVNMTLLGPVTTHQQTWDLWC